MNGTIIDMGNGQYGFETMDTFDAEPKRVRHVWVLDTVTTRGMSWCDPKSALGKPATLRYGAMSCYLGNGNYLNGQVDPNKPAEITEVSDVPQPKCRTETRWYRGQWQKLLRKGWVAA